MTTKTASTFNTSWRGLMAAVVLALGSVSAAQADTNIKDARGTNTHINNSNCNSPFDTLQLNATRTLAEGTPPYNGNVILAMSDVTYWYPFNNCWESATWTANGTGRKTAKVTGVQENPNPTSVADFYLTADRFIKLRNLTIDNVDLDYDNIDLRLYTSGLVTPAPDISLTLNNGSITGVNPPSFYSQSNFRLTATGDSTISNWWTRVSVQSPTTMNVTGSGSRLTFFRVGQPKATYSDALYFHGTSNTALIDGATLKLDQSTLTFGKPSPTPDPYGQMTFQNGATLELVGPDTKLESGRVSFINSSLKFGLGGTQLIVDAGLTFNGASADIVDSGKVTTQAFEVFGSNTIALPKESSIRNYTVKAGIVLMHPDSSLTLSGDGSLASDFELRWPFSPSGHYGHIVINDNASLVNDGGIFRINPGAPITINRTNGNVFGSLIVKHSGVIELLGSAGTANVINHGEVSAYDDGGIAVPSSTFTVQGGNQGLISIASGGLLILGNVGTALGATALLTTDNRVSLDSFSTLQMVIEPTARKNSQLRTSSEVFISNFADLNLSLDNDQVLPVGTRFVLIDYGSLAGTGGVAGNANRYFNGYRDGSSFVLGLNRYRINYKDSGDAGFAGAVTLTVIPLVPPVAALTPTPQTVSGTVGVSITPSAALVPSAFGGTVTYSINPALPSGMRFDLVTGVISGVPTQALAAAPFTIRGVGATSGDANATVNLTIAQAGQTITFGPTPSATYTPGGGLVLSASASSGLPVSYSSLTPAVCTAGSGAVHMVSAGNCTIAADQPGNANYSATPQVTQTIAIAKAQPAPLTLTGAPTIINVGATSTLLTSGGSGTGAISFSITSGPCSIAGATLTGTATGTCHVTATQAADVNYNAITSNPVTVNVSLSMQAALSLSASPGTISTNGTSTLSTTGGSGTGGITYTVTSGSCTITGSTLIGTVAGSCAVVATKAADANYGAATSSPVTVTVNLSSQIALVLTANPASLNVNDTSNLSSSGGSGTGAVTYAVVSGPCSVLGSTLTATGAGTCSVSASKAADATFGAVTSAPVDIAVSLAPQAALVLSASPGNVSAGGTSTLSTTGGSGTGNVSYALISGPCTLVGSTLNGTGSGSCLVMATKAASTVYAATNSNPVAVSVVLAPQTSLILSATPAAINVNGTSTLNTKGGDGSGDVSYSVNDGPCSISANTLTGTAQGQCHITATKAASGIYGAVTSSPVTITVSLATQAGLLLNASPQTITTNGTSALSTTGGSGSRTVSYAVSSGACTISGSTLTSTAAGSCDIVATKAADSVYASASSSPVNVTVSLSPQATLLLNASPTPVSAGGVSTLSTSGGNGTGAVSYTVTSGSCVVVGNTLSGLGTGSCSVTATKAADSTYSAATSAPISVTTLSSLVLVANPTVITVNGASTLSASASGGQGSGAVSFSLVSGPCTLTSSTLNGVGQGQCQVVATRAGDGTVGLATSSPVTVTVSLLTPPTLVLNASQTSVGFGGSSTLSTSGGIAGGPVTYTVSGPCYVSGNTLTGTSGGTCQVTATQAATSVYSATSSSALMLVVKERATTFSYPTATAVIGQMFTLTPTTAGFTNPTFAVLYGSLPAGLSLDARTGVISGTPTGPATTSDAVISVFENNAYDAALAILTVEAAQAAQGPAPIPTLSEWAMILLTGLLALTAFFAMRKKRPLDRPYR